MFTLQHLPRRVRSAMRSAAQYGHPASAFTALGAPDALPGMPLPARVIDPTGSIPHPVDDELARTDKLPSLDDRREGWGAAPGPCRNSRRGLPIPYPQVATKPSGPGPAAGVPRGQCREPMLSSPPCPSAAGRATTSWTVPPGNSCRGGRTTSSVGPRVRRPASPLQYVGRRVGGRRPSVLIPPPPETPAPPPAHDSHVALTRPWVAGIQSISRRR